MTEESYHGTRGHSGSDSSRDAAYADLTSGVTNATQKYVLIMAAQAGERGITVAELREAKGGLHHGRISSAITKQHIAGKLVALTERRGHCGIYVLPEFVAGRETRPYRRQNVRLQVDDVEAFLRDHSPKISGCACGHPYGGPSRLWVTWHRRHVAEQIVALSRGEQ